MRDHLSAVLPLVRIPEMGPALPVPDNPGLFIPLHPHVQVSESWTGRILGAQTSLTSMRNSHPSTLVTGSKSHKSVTKEQSRILWSYYNNNRTLFFFCACNELFFVALYLIQWYPEPLGIHTRHLLAYLPKEWILKTPESLLRFIENKLTWPYLLAAITFPVCLGKQIINCVQFWKVCCLLLLSPPTRTPMTLPDFPLATGRQSSDRSRQRGEIHCSAS